MCIVIILDTHKTVRTNIVIDDRLMANALQATSLTTKKEVVELGLKTLIKLKQQEKIKAFKGRLKWSGDLDSMRNYDAHQDCDR